MSNFHSNSLLTLPTRKEIKINLPQKGYPSPKEDSIETSDNIQELLTELYKTKYPGQFLNELTTKMRFQQVVFQDQALATKLWKVTGKIPETSIKGEGTDVNKKEAKSIKDFVLFRNCSRENGFAVNAE